QELLRLRDEGALDDYQAQWFRFSKSEEELFDTAADPHELHNLANDSAYATVLGELRDELARWMETTDDKGFVAEAELLDQFWPNRIQPVTSKVEARADGGEITLQCPTDGASIGYQILTAGEEPPDGWQVYANPLTLSEGQSVRAIAHRLGFAPSEVIEVE
ncbi:MAG: hypothetical protein R3178_01370, partial [Rhodothermales bacterium]|nr:hypothetical protein [Rhodothermales bacterium]